MAKSLEKSLRLELALRHRRWVSVLQNPKAAVPQQAGGSRRVPAHHKFQCKTPLGFWCPVLTVLEQVLRLFMTFMYSSCSADHGQGEFSCWRSGSSHYWNHSWSKRQGYSWTLFKPTPSPLDIITESAGQTSQIAIIPWNPRMDPTSRKHQSLPQGQELSSDRIQSFHFSSGNRSRTDGTCYFSVPGAHWGTCPLKYWGWSIWWL